MTETAHTPGPWEYEAGEPVSCVSTKVNGKCTDIAYLSLPNHAANARLIAAAPDLLEALETALTMLDALKVESGRGIEWDEEDAFRMGEWFDAKELDAMKNMRAAIAKAKGGAE